MFLAVLAQTLAKPTPRAASRRAKRTDVALGQKQLLAHSLTSFCRKLTKKGPKTCPFGTSFHKTCFLLFFYGGMTTLVKMAHEVAALDEGTPQKL